MVTSSQFGITNNAVNPRNFRKIAVLMGGNSPEREVSLRSGKRIAEALRKRGYSVATVDPSHEYRDEEMVFYQSEPPHTPCRKKRRRRNCRNCPKRAYCPNGGTEFSTDSTRHSTKPTHINTKTVEFTASSIKFCQKSHTVFMALHGGAGEDGRIAAVLECLGIPHTGSDHKGLCISMDKPLSKRILLQLGIPTPCFVVIGDGEFPHIPQADGEETIRYHGELPHIPA